MSKKKNRYAQKAKKKGFMAEMNEGLPTKGNAKNSLLETGKGILVGVLGGGLIGAAIGRPSLLVGILTTGAGHYTGNKLVQLFGLGIMASNSFQKATGTVSGLEGLDGIKERLQAYKEALTERLYLDKIIKKKQAATNGVGELQYFTYPDNSMSGTLAALDDIEDQIAESARQFQGQLRGDGDLLMGDEYDIGELAGHIY
jgi:hypothetical protein